MLIKTGMLCGILGLVTGAGLVVLAQRGGPAHSAGQPTAQEIVDRFHRLYYDSGEETWQRTRWLGVLTSKMPLDMWIYQEILYDIKPDVLIECGTFVGVARSISPPSWTC